MPGISLVGVDSAGGTILGGGQTLVKVNGTPIAVVGDAVAPHGKSPHRSAKMVSGSAIMKINGIPVCRAGDSASCGHTATGQPWFNVD